MDKNRADALAKALKQIEEIKHEPSKRDSEPFRPEYRQPAIAKAYLLETVVSELWNNHLAGLEDGQKQG